MSEEKKKDALADALAALAAGEHHEEAPPEGSGMEAHAQPAAPPPAAPRRAAPPAPRAGGPPTPVARSGAPVPKRPAPPTPAQATERTPPAPPSAPRTGAPSAPRASAPRPAATPRSDGMMRPASPNSKVRPSMPGQAVPRSLAPQSRQPAPPPAPVAPPPPVEPPAPPVEEVFEATIEEPAELTPAEQAAAHEATMQAEAEAVGNVVEDDDTLNLPAPSPEALAHRRAPRVQRELMSRRIGFKQTMIPILLTMGVLFTGIAAWSFSMGEESPVFEEPKIPVSVLVVGVLMLGFGIFTMLQVRAQLAREKHE